MKNKIFIIFLLLTGCSLAPTYDRPPLPVSATWPESLQPNGASNVEANKLEWRKFFTDERLLAIIKTALENNRDLRVAIARVEEARAIYGVARADRLPNIDVVGNTEKARSLNQFSGGEAQTIITRQYDIGLNFLAFELDLWGRVRNLSKSAQSTYLAQEQTGQAFRLSLIAEVANAYLTSLELQERMKLAEATVNSLQQRRHLTDRRREHGLSSQFDFLFVESALTQRQAELAILRQQSAAADNALLVLMGQSVADLPTQRTLAEMTLPDEFGPILPSYVLLTRPDVQAAEYKLMGANANIGAVRAAFFPKISLVGALGFASTELKELFEGHEEVWNTAAEVRAPLFSGGRYWSNLKLSHARKKIALAEYEKTIQQAFREVADELSARRQLAEQLSALETNLKANAERLQIIQKQFEQGLVSELEVLEVQEALHQSEQAFIQAKRQRLGNAVQLYKALGGGLILAALKK